MHVRSNTLKAVILAVAALFLASSLWAPVAQANMIGTETVAGTEELKEARADVLELLARDDVRDRLTAWGVDPEEAEARVMTLTAEELHALEAEMDDLPAGAGVGSVVSAALIVFLVLLITDILGYTNVFPFVTDTAR